MYILFTIKDIAYLVNTFDGNTVSKVSFIASMILIKK